MSLPADRQLRVENARLRKRLVQARRHVRELRQALHRVYEPTYYALRLASTTYDVPISELRAVGHCESGLWPFARNGQYRGLFQEGPMFESGRFGRAGFSVWDPIANAMTAAATVKEQGWRQWECRP